MTMPRITRLKIVRKRPYAKNSVAKIYTYGNNELENTNPSIVCVIIIL